MARSDLAIGQRVVWWVTGRLATMIEERYEDPTEAVIAPTVSFALAVALAYLALVTGWSAAGRFAGLFAALMGLIFLETALASLWYYIEPQHREVIR